MKKIGIVGGVGPEASNKFCELLIKRTNKSKDQENIPFVHLCNPQIPDRTDFIINGTNDPRPAIIETCHNLEKLGCDFLVIPCNTAHVFLQEIQEEVTTPIVDMTKVLMQHIYTNNPSIKRIGVLATTGSLKSKLFEKYLELIGVETINLDEYEQENLVMGSVYGKKGIKAGKKQNPKKLLKLAANRLIEMGAQSIIIGCTEISLVLKQKDVDVKIYDPMDIVAREIIKYIGKEKTEVVTVKYVLRDVLI